MVPFTPKPDEDEERKEFRTYSSMVTKCVFERAMRTGQPMTGSADFGITDTAIVATQPKHKEMGLTLDSMSDLSVRDDEVVATSTNIRTDDWAKRRNLKEWEEISLRMISFDFFIAANPRSALAKNNGSILDALSYKGSQDVEIIPAVEPVELDVTDPLPYIMNNWCVVILLFGKYR